jgi:hypothetical protein
MKEEATTGMMKAGAGAAGPLMTAAHRVVVLRGKALPVAAVRLRGRVRRHDRGLLHGRDTLLGRVPLQEETLIPVSIGIRTDSLRAAAAGPGMAAVRGRTTTVVRVNKLKNIS